jgi:hypothetical protein
VQQGLGERSDVSVLAVMPGTPVDLRRLRRERGLRLRLVADPTWSLHGALGLRRGRWHEIWLSPPTLLAYLRLLGRRRLRRPAQDVLPLGGDVVLDPRGLVTWVYRSRHPADRPAIVEIIRQLDAAARGDRGP